MKFIDAHAHLDDEEFDADREEVIRKARGEGIWIVNAGCDPQSNRMTLELAERHDNVLACLGLWPLDCVELGLKNVEEEIKFIKERGEQIVGIGEIGLDFKWKKEEEVQEKAFRMLLELAEEMEKPVVVHSRAAVGDVLRILKEYELDVLLHSFPGNREQMKEAIQMGYFASVGPNIVRSPQKQLLVELYPLDLLLTETDSPVLAPRPSERNEPINVKIVVKEIARIKEKDEEEVREEVLRNAIRFFKLRL